MPRHPLFCVLVAPSGRRPPGSMTARERAPARATVC